MEATSGVLRIGLMVVSNTSTMTLGRSSQVQSNTGSSRRLRSDNQLPGTTSHEGFHDTKQWHFPVVYGKTYLLCSVAITAA